MPTHYLTHDRRDATLPQDWDDERAIREMIRRAHSAAADGVLDAVQFMQDCERRVYSRHIGE